MAFRFPVIALTSFLALSTVAQAAPKVVVSIKPLHGLVSGVMDGVGKPELLIKAVQSPHHFSLKPSDARKVQNADAVIWVSEELETNLAKSLKSLNSKGLSLVMLAEEHDDHKEHDKHDDHDHHDNHKGHDDEHDHHHEIDAHIWLDPRQAIEMVEKIEAGLSKIDPASAKTYAKNAHNLHVKLEKLDHDIHDQLHDVEDKAFVVFHDAFGHFNKRYHMNQAGVVALSPESAPGAKHIRHMRELVKTKNVKCVFYEPQFSDKMVKTVIEGTQIKTAKLDPLGADFDAGPQHYFQMMNNIGTTLKTCLGS
ncbi:zinc ABC transporter substrate-binding protein [Terasakiella sp. A23]|uniref:zinc ABC transporter substrate-binding protein n=1 Tax=Terasakiella sp. FCG-A23 TaxID=3080561 RepID=UPI002952DBC6|nr:zinc ABC transporter substrate-binding protein [Terasakiella sp. A23]MDV7340502.1 zinc ABC transporter substrate-binding protein [Terasakiella sp. A23]